LIGGRAIDSAGFPVWVRVSLTGEIEFSVRVFRSDIKEEFIFIRFLYRREPFFTREVFSQLSVYEISPILTYGDVEVSNVEVLNNLSLQCFLNLSLQCFKPVCSGLACSGDFDYTARMRDWIFDFELWRHHFLDGALEASARRLHVPPILARKVNGLKIV
jgi:hypothetical protein